MGNSSNVPQQVGSGSEPRRWIAAIVGGVLLGEAMWAMLQLLIRDWAAPALANALSALTGKRLRELPLTI